MIVSDSGPIIAFKGASPFLPKEIEQALLKICPR